ncbi:MAG: TlpA family protein disulfide reductase [Actinomycetota bacterium]
MTDEREQSTGREAEEPTPRSGAGGEGTAAGYRHAHRRDGTSLDHPSALPGSSRLPRRQMRWVMVAVVMAAVVLVASLLAFGLSRDPTLIGSPLVGRRAPDFALPTLEGGRTVRLSDLRGQVVVVNFWASWCAACREEHPNLLGAWERYRDHGVVLVGIDYQDSRRAALDYMAELGGDWPVLDDPGGRTALAYGVYGVPETFFIARDGVIAYKRVGASSYELLTEQIQGLLSRGDKGGRWPP